VALTAAGRELIDRAFAEHMENERSLLEGLTPQQAAELEALLTAWLAGIEPPPGP
ncbi:MarR family transcriptional regulator, partial [Streptomyces sp. SID7760]|nr:MarR family transcriptional regulator [Streptomyces sp. SID7760]